MHIILSIIVPVFGVVGFGYAATFTPVFDASAARGLSAFVFFFALPVMLFHNLATTQLPATITWSYLASYYVATGIMLLGGTLLIGRGRLDQRVIVGFSGAYSNTVLLGIPLILTALGPTASLPLFLLIAFHSPIFFTLITTLMEIGQGGGASLRELPLRTLKGLARNIILLSVVAGILYNLAGLHLPAAIDHWAAMVGKAALPGALFSMGASLRQYKVAGAINRAVLVVLAKLVIHPALVACLVLLVFKVPPLWAHTAILAASLPVGINVYLFAVRYGVGEAESATAILLSNLVSVATVTMVLALLGVTPASTGPQVAAKVVPHGSSASLAPARD